MAMIEKKFWPETYELFASGKRKLELRLADFDLKEGDVILAREWDPKTKEYTGRTKELKVKKAEQSIKDPLKFWPIEKIQEKGFLIIEFE